MPSELDNTEQDNNEPVGEEKRRYPRFPLRAYAELQYSTKTWEAHVLDLSETGARLALLDEHLLQKGDALRVHIDLDNLSLVASDKKHLNLHGRIVHVREHVLGFDFQPDTPIDKTVLYELLMHIENQ